MPDYAATSHRSGPTTSSASYAIGRCRSGGWCGDVDFHIASRGAVAGLQRREQPEIGAGRRSRRTGVPQRFHGASTPLLDRPERRSQIQRPDRGRQPAPADHLYRAAWVVTDDAEKCLFAITATGEPATIDVGGAATAQLAPPPPGVQRADCAARCGAATSAGRTSRPAASAPARCGRTGTRSSAASRDGRTAPNFPDRTIPAQGPLSTLAARRAGSSALYSPPSVGAVAGLDWHPLNRRVEVRIRRRS